jgi:hypothetical protein
MVFQRCCKGFARQPHRIPSGTWHQTMEECQRYLSRRLNCFCRCAAGCSRNNTRLHRTGGGRLTHRCRVQPSTQWLRPPALECKARDSNSRTEANQSDCGPLGELSPANPKGVDGRNLRLWPSADRISLASSPGCLRDVPRFNVTIPKPSHCASL